MRKIDSYRQEVSVKKKKKHVLTEREARSYIKILNRNRIFLPMTAGAKLCKYNVSECKAIIECKCRIRVRLQKGNAKGSKYKPNHCSIIFHVNFVLLSLIYSQV